LALVSAVFQIALAESGFPVAKEWI